MPIINGEPYCPNYRCTDCGLFQSCSKMDGKAPIHPARTFFGTRISTFPCCDFVPSAICVFDLKHYWTNYENWYADWLIEWKNGMSKEAFERTPVALCFGKDYSVRYHVRMKDWIYGTMYENRTLKAFEKMYYKQTRKGFGYSLIRESIDGVEIQDLY